MVETNYNTKEALAEWAIHLVDGNEVLNFDERLKAKATAFRTIREGGLRGDVCGALLKAGFDAGKFKDWYF